MVQTTPYIVALVLMGLALLGLMAGLFAIIRKRAQDRQGIESARQASKKVRSENTILRQEVMNLRETVEEEGKEALKKVRFENTVLKQEVMNLREVVKEEEQKATKKFGQYKTHLKRFLKRQIFPQFSQGFFGIQETYQQFWEQLKQHRSQMQSQGSAGHSNDEADQDKEATASPQEVLNRFVKSYAEWLAIVLLQGAAPTKLIEKNRQVAAIDSSQKNEAREEIKRVLKVVSEITQRYIKCMPHVRTVPVFPEEHEGLLRLGICVYQRAQAEKKGAVDLGSDPDSGEEPSDSLPIDIL